MKTHPSRQNDSRGSVMLVTMCILAVGLIALASYLMIVQAENNSVSRSQTWNSIVSVAEAGLEEGLAAVNQGLPSPNQNNWTNSVSGVWTYTNGGYKLSRTVYGSNSYTVFISTAADGSPTVSSIGTAPYTPVPWAFSCARGPFMAQIGTTTSGTSSTLGRKLQVNTVLSALFSAAIVTRSNINFKGQNATIDSFDSSNPLYSLNGNYSVGRRKDNGVVGTDSSIVNTLNVGNGNIWGSVKTGPGTAQTAVQIGSGGKVGDANFQATGASGTIETGHWAGDFNVNTTDVTAPTFSGASSLPSNGTNIGGVSYDHVLSGNYVLPAGTGLGVIYVSGPTQIWIQGGGNADGVTIATNNSAKLILYAGTTNGSGDTFKLSGNQSCNQPGYAVNCQFYGLPSLNNLTTSGNSGFNAVFYAPDADFKGGGSGSTPQDDSGSIVVRSITLTGGFNFHYDESLGVSGPARGWIPKNWTELKYP